MAFFYLVFRLLASGIKTKGNPETHNLFIGLFAGSLTTLSLRNCNLSDDAIPRDFGGLFLLHTLILSGNPICSLPESIKDLSILKLVNLGSCERLQSLPNFPMSLKHLYLDDCLSLEKIINLRIQASLELDVIGCVKLDDIPGRLKFEPLRNNAAKIIGNFSWSELESMGNVEVNLHNVLTWTERKYPLQAVYDCGVLNTFLPLSEVPSWFEVKSIMPSAFFNVPSLPNHKIEGLNIRAVYCWQRPEVWNDYDDGFTYVIRNVTKHLKWEYGPTVHGIPADDGKCIMWLSYWKIGNHLEGGDEVEVSFYEFGPNQLKEMGIHVVFEEEGRGSNTTMQSDWPLVEDGPQEFDFNLKFTHY